MPRIKALPLKTCECGQKITGTNAKFIGHQHLGDISMSLYNCPKCKTTKSIKHTKGEGK